MPPPALPSSALRAENASPNRKLDSAFFKHAAAQGLRESSFTRALQMRHEQARGETWIGPSVLLVSAEPGKHADELALRATFDKATIGVMGDRSSVAARHICPSCPLLSVLDAMASVDGQRHYASMVCFPSSGDSGQVEWISCAAVDPGVHDYPILSALVWGAEDDLRDELQLNLCATTPAMNPSAARALLNDFIQACESARAPTWELLCVLGVLAHLKHIAFENVLAPDGKVVAMLGIKSIPSLTMCARVMGVERRALEAHLAYSGGTMALIHAFRDGLVRRLYQAAMHWVVDEARSHALSAPCDLCVWEKPSFDSRLLLASVLNDQVAALRDEGVDKVADALDHKFGPFVAQSASPTKPVTSSGVKVPPLAPRNETFAQLFARPASDLAHEELHLEAALGTRYWLLCARYTDIAGAFVPSLAQTQNRAFGISDVAGLLAASYPGRASLWECAALARAAAGPDSNPDEVAASERVARAFGATEWRVGSSMLFFRGAAALETMLWDMRLGRDPRGDCVKAMTRLRLPRMIVRVSCTLAFTKLLQRVRAKQNVKQAFGRIKCRLAFRALLFKVRAVACHGWAHIGHSAPGQRRFVVLCSDGILRVLAWEKGAELEQYVLVQRWTEPTRNDGVLRLVCTGERALVLNAGSDAALWSKALAALFPSARTVVQAALTVAAAAPSPPSEASALPQPVVVEVPAAAPTSPSTPESDAKIEEAKQQPPAEEAQSPSCISAAALAPASQPPPPTPAAAAAERPKPARPAARLPQRKVPTKVISLMTELVETERAYVSDLHLMVLHYYRPLELALVKDESKAMLSGAELASVFSNTEQVLKANQELLSAMASTNPESLARAFGEMVPFLKRIYTVYVGNYSNSAAALDKAQKTRPRFAAFLREAGKNGKLLDLESYLIKPVQRVCKYPLFFKQMVDAFEPGDDASLKASFVSAFEGVDSVAREVNLLQQTGEKAARAAALVCAIEGLDKEGLSLLDPSRVFLTEFDCDVVVSDAVKPSDKVNYRTMFLYSDALLETKPNPTRTKFKFKRWLDLSTTIIESVDDGLTISVMSFGKPEQQQAASARARRSSTGGSVLGMTRKRISIGGRSSSASALPNEVERLSLVFCKTTERDQAFQVVRQAAADLSARTRGLESRRGSGTHRAVQPTDDQAKLLDGAVQDEEVSRVATSSERTAVAATDTSVDEDFDIL